MPNGGCTVTTEADCIAKKGDYKGDGSSCDECPPPGPIGTGGGCGSLLWTAVLLLAAGFTALAFHVCAGVPQLQVILFVLGWALIAVYAVMMIIWSILKFLSKCPETLCQVAAIHMAVLGPLALVLGVLSFFVACIWIPAVKLLAVYLGGWAAIAAGCL